ncbi:hypothetical protein BDV38DRAFT_239222 [Aspergillus pseudotamarii]|uniref:Uncharacterized protein n=1 Tax=Aspergillus pseudotamarii TaxID=132259 RepID=A0A5N6T336_ASPPS|nr:uncharacterized protein BDV38DRAFT_239222 [Aspergillus pseudotamarii]KAE8140722.1 hypothetical protein BDV38DRAFT_239222 [Aspergillus pseudotamarii]
MEDYRTECCTMPKPTLPSVRSTVPDNSCSRIPMRVSNGSRRHSLSWLCGRPSNFFFYPFLPNFFLQFLFLIALLF